MKYLRKKACGLPSDGKNSVILRGAKSLWNPYYLWANGVLAYSTLNILYPYVDL